jgi:4-amino-4-deoxy-L-arabinose transferase-like glycosyltransferase
MKTHLHIHNIHIRVILFAILLLAAFLRFYNLNWDNGLFLHPDERAIVMKVAELKFPHNLSEFLSPQSPWNPKFFAYGSFPMYLLRVTGNALGAFSPDLGSFASLTIFGRLFSALSDIISVGLVYLLGKKLFSPRIGLLGAFFYAISVLPIQLSHFYAVDTLLTTCILATLYSTLLFYEKPGVKNALRIGLFLGLALAIKISSLILLAAIGMTLIADFLLLFLKNPLPTKHWRPKLLPSFKHIAFYGFSILAATFAVFVSLEPYALIDFKTFWYQTVEQSALTNDPFYFPYTLQFVGKIPYLYELKNIYLWGLGPVLGTLSFAGSLFFLFRLFKMNRDSQFAKELIVAAFFITYLFVVGRFAVGFMRYMLPVYPLFALFAAMFIFKFISSIKSKTLRLVIGYSLMVISLIWPLSFIQIYAQPNTRAQASEWIYANIPQDKIIAIEHWDDPLPMGKSITYPTVILKLYDPDTEMKWDELEQQLAVSDFIVIASNRLYIPLQKLTDCTILPAYRCYPRTAVYYKKLFSGELGFEKVAEFTNHPRIPLINVPINDQSADENFTVFDHPKVMIFQNMKKHSTM